MNNFIFQNPTKLIFGKNTISNLTKEIPLSSKIMITFGGGSVKKNNVYSQVTKALDSHNYIEFWGIEPNPSVQTLRKAIALGKENKVDFLLAVGGGSVIDGTKLISAALNFDGDAWELVRNPSLINEMTPYASVLTLPATGSEMNRGAVISNTETQEKYSFYSSYPKFSILDPETTYTLPKFQISCGIADTFVHVMEQYLTKKTNPLLMDRWAEGILQTLIDIAPRIKKDQTDYEAMANFMLSATMALNGFIGMGCQTDWATHMIGHEVTALTGVTHGQTLAVILPATMSVLRKQKCDKILQYGERVFGIKGNDDLTIDKIIEKTKEFFRSLELATSLTELNIDEKIIFEIEKRFNERKVKLGEDKNVDGTVAKEILMACK
ncbi:MAG: iron-containing alcohol dehydrogenase [Ignavibacteria bacterium]|jgi:NADP-dependent alcohol dehydrogenase|nr:iron-containing alcohol dehydrogenase [Ignavibacteria bacterium]